MGLRPPHYSFILENLPKVAWFEAISENYMDSGGRPLTTLLSIREHYPLALHGVSLSIGSSDPLDTRYLKNLSSLIQKVEPAIVSDHLCWTGVEGKNVHDLLPLPYTEEALNHVAARILKVQDTLKRKILIENVSSYVEFKSSEMKEWEFLTEVATRADCGILLDVNNIYVSGFNHGFDPFTYIQHIPAERIGQIHVAGHSDMGTYLFDTHGSHVIDKVWELYRHTISTKGEISTLVEWDSDIPDFQVLQDEVDKSVEMLRNAA